MYKNTTTLILGIIIVVLNLHIGFANEKPSIITLNDLIENGSSYNNKVVTVTGEVIGENLKRGIYSWININDGSNSMGIWIKGKEINNIKYFGDFKHQGDIIIVKGIFNRSCNKHGGDMDIHCENMQIKKSGYTKNNQVEIWKLLSGVILTTLSLAIFSFYYRHIRKKNNHH